MSRSLWRCRNPQCSVPHGAVLGRITSDGGLVLERSTTQFCCYLDTRRVTVTCPECSAAREFRGTMVSSSRAYPNAGASSSS